MKARLKRRPLQWLKRHWLSMTIVLVLIAGACVANWHLMTQADATETQARAARETYVKEMDKTIAAIKERKAAEEKARKEADAKAASEEVLSTTEGQATSFDAKRCNVSQKHTDATSPSVLVNKKHCIQPLTYTPPDLVTVYGATLRPEAADAFKRLYEAAQAAGVPISVTSSYRSYSNQVSTYQYWVATSGVAGADTYSARPGYSEHQTGFALDLASASGCSLDCFGTTPQYQWMQQHAAEYGFIQRYYAGYESITGYTAEEWHYRYVGPDTAADLQRKGIKTLEQYWNLPGGTY